MLALALVIATLAIPNAMMAQDWITWLVSFPVSKAPIYDDTGLKVQTANSDRAGIFYLTGAPYHNVTRQVFIDSAKYRAIFLPVIDGIFTYQPTGFYMLFGNPQHDLEQRNAKFHITLTIAEFDGYPVTIHHLKSAVFMNHYNNDNPYKIKEGDWNTLISGDFVYLPVVEGNHTLHIKGQDTDGYHTEVLYHLRMAGHADLIKNGIIIR